MRYHISHTTEYLYDQPTLYSYNEAWISPRELDYQQIISTSLSITPEPSALHFKKDFYQNKVAFFALHQPHDYFNLTASTELVRKVPFEGILDDYPDDSWESLETKLKDGNFFDLDINQFLLPSPMIIPSRKLVEYASKSFTPGRPLFEAVWELTQRIYDEFEYNPNFTTIATPLKEALTARKGVCQDFAQIAIGCLRSMGLPARYISGYIETLPPEGEEQLVGSAASHAWFSAYIPHVGWVDFDPTNNQIAGSQHITIAWGRDYSDVPPLKGVIYNSGKHKLKVAVDVVRVEEKVENPT